MIFGKKVSKIKKKMLVAQWVQKIKFFNFCSNFFFFLIINFQFKIQIQIQIHIFFEFRTPFFQNIISQY
jgi:hypothetical protein